MADRCGWVLLVLLLIGITQARAGEKVEFDRTLAKEPVYQSKEQGYFLLAIGPEAKKGVWVVADQDVVFVDLNGDRDLTGAGERVPMKDGWKPRKAIASDRPVKIMSLAKASGGFFVAVDVEGKRLQYGSIQPAHRREDAPVLRFDGPLAMGLASSGSDKQPLRRGSKPYEFAALITTIGPSQKGVWGPVVNHSKYVPASAHPVADFEFAPRNAGAAPPQTSSGLEPALLRMPVSRGRVGPEGSSQHEGQGHRLLPGLEGGRHRLGDVRGSYRGGLA